MTKSNLPSPFDPKSYYPREPLSRGFRGRVRAGTVALHAFREIVVATSAIQVQLGLLILTLLLGWWRHFGELDYLMVAFVFGLGIYAEANNTTQEKIADQLMLQSYRASGAEPHLSDSEIIHSRGHVSIRVIKDYAAGAVTPIFLLAAIVITILLIRPL